MQPTARRQEPSSSSPVKPPPCPVERDTERARGFYARGATLVPQLGVGLRSRNRALGSTAASTESRSPRLAVVMPWVLEEKPSSACAEMQAKPEMKAGARCEAFFTLPVSWPYWLASAGRNAGIADFLIFRDPRLSDNFFRGPDGSLTVPPNVHVREVANLTVLYRTQMSSPSLFLNPDKVKDFKPTIGHVFEEYLRPYSHWAFGDVDVVYGDLRRFLTPHVLSHDIITFRTDDLCASMTKTVFAGQFTIFANNAWGRTIYRDAPAWAKVSNSERYMFFDERSMPSHVLRVGGPRVAMLINQLSDRLFTRSLDNPMRGLWMKAGVAREQRHLIWHGDDGRLLLVDRRRPTADAAAAPTAVDATVAHNARTARASGPHVWCVVSEAALVHLQQHKFKHFGATPTFDARGFVFDRDKGIQPASSLINGSSGDSKASVASILVRPLREGLGGSRCAQRTITSNMERSMF